MIEPWALGKAKAVVWFWLNYHPAECSSSPMEMQLEVAHTKRDSKYEPDMSILNVDGWGEYRIGDANSGFAFINIDHDSWHDANVAIKEWFEGMNPADRNALVEYLEDRKGEPLKQWHKAYHRSTDSPDWAALAEILKVKGII